MTDREWSSGMSIREGRRDRALVIKEYPDGVRVMVYDRKANEHIGIKLTFEQVEDCIKMLDQSAAKYRNMRREFSKET